MEFVVLDTLCSFSFTLCHDEFLKMVFLFLGLFVSHQKVAAFASETLRVCSDDGERP